MKLSIAIILLALTFRISAIAQKEESNSDIVLNAYVSDQVEEISESSKNILKSRLDRITSEYGFGSDTYNPRFIITPNISVLSKDITATSPPLVALTLDVTLMIGDGLEGIKFSSTSLELKGVGKTETKAYISALKQLRLTDKMEKFIRKSEDKIISYYNSRCDLIIMEANQLASIDKYNHAIAKLSGIPMVCDECFGKGMNALEPILKNKMEYDCKTSFMTAQSVWNSSQNMKSANAAGAILSTISPNATCYDQVVQLSNKIAQKVSEIDKREWKYIMKDQEQTSERIQAARDIGVAYGNNQPETQYHIGKWFR